MMKKIFVVYYKPTMTVVMQFKYRKVAEKWAARNGEGYGMAEYREFLDLRDNGPTKVVRSLMTGAEITIARNTPLCCDPSSETYWSM